MKLRDELIAVIERRMESLSDNQFSHIFNYKITHQKFLRQLSALLNPPPGDWVVVNSEIASNYQIIPKQDVLFSGRIPNVDLEFEDNPFPSNDRLENCSFLIRLSSLGQRFWQAPIYSFSSFPVLESHGEMNTIRVTCHLKTYCDYLITGEYMAFELAAAVVEAGIDSENISEETIEILRPLLPAREMIHDNPRWTYIKCGVVTPIVMKTVDRGYVLPLMKRSSSVSESQGLWQTIPAGSFQPEHPDDTFHDDDFSFLNCALKETAEELFGYESPTILHQSSMNEIQSLEPIRAMCELLNSGAAEFVVTGFGIEALTNRIDFTAMLVIHDAAWYTEYGKLLRIGDEGAEWLLIEPQLEGLPAHIKPDSLSAMSELAILRVSKYLSHKDQ
ncbi:MAG: hypothetical protein R3F48_16945 [Candidatus Zixiibacteriota bacterium]